MCEGCIISTLSTDNSVELLRFADLHNNETLKHGVMTFMVNNASVSFRTPGLVESLGPVLCTELFTFLATHVKAIG